MDKFNENLKLLLEQIVKVFPEQQENIENIYKFENPGDKYLRSFYLNCRNMGDDVSSKNEIIFSKENTILEGVDFYEIWNSDKLNADMKKNIWKYLHTLYIYAYEYEKDQDLKTIIQELKKMGGSREDMDEDTRTLANIIDSLTGKFDKAPEGMEEDEKEGSSDEPFANFAPPELFDGMIGDLAKEIAEEINPEELNLDDPSQLLKDLMSGNFDVNNDSSGITNLVKNITGKIQSKLASGNLDESALFAEAQNVMQNFGKGGKGGGPFGGQMGKMFETMMHSGMSSGMDEEEMNIFQNAQSIINNGGGNAQALQTQYNRKQTKDRLRAKLEEKKRMLEEKERELAEKAKMQADYEANVDLDALAAEIEAIGSSNSENNSNAKKSKKSKKKKH